MCSCTLLPQFGNQALGGLRQQLGQRKRGDALNQSREQNRQDQGRSSPV